MKSTNQNCIGSILRAEAAADFPATTLRHQFGRQARSRFKARAYEAGARPKRPEQETSSGSSRLKKIQIAGAVRVFTARELTVFLTLFLNVVSVSSIFSSALYSVESGRTAKHICSAGAMTHEIFRPRPEQR